MEVIKNVLVIGASGFVGKPPVEAPLANGYAVRGLARDPARVKALTTRGCEVMQGDSSDPASIQRAFDLVDAAYISIHTLSPQPGAVGQSFIDVEIYDLQNIILACRFSTPA